MLWFLTNILLIFKYLDEILIKEFDELVMEFCIQLRLLIVMLLGAELMYNKTADYCRVLSEYTCIKLFWYLIFSITRLI